MKRLMPELEKQARYHRDVDRRLSGQEGDARSQERAGYEALIGVLLDEIDALREAPFDGKKIQRPHCFIQWKGTEVCADVYCECGEQGHIDAEFMYAVRCPKCGAVYEVGDMMALRRVDRWDGCEPRTWAEFEPGLEVMVEFQADGVVGIRRCAVEFPDPVKPGYYVVRALDGSEEQLRVSVEVLRKTREPQGSAATDV